MKLRLFFALAAALIFSFPGNTFAANHTVNSGESLYLISTWYGTSIEIIKSANNLTDDTIYSGQHLFIPENQSQRAPISYTVRPGETLYLIGSYFGVDYTNIMSANGLISTDIYPGQTLVIPSANVAADASQVSRGGVVLTGRVPYARSDFDLLSRLITAEADSESYQTKVAVGAVVINRILSGLFPRTIPGVIYQVDEGGAYQFEPVLNGWINVTPSEPARLAAQEALNGVDPTKGALYFFESWVPNSFLQSRPLSMVSDSFTFTY